MKEYTIELHQLLVSRKYKMEKWKKKLNFY